MKIAISQPTFLPWQGYFALIDHVDEFIFLDNVQFVKRSWLQRNKIKSNNKECLITVSVETKGKRFQSIKEAKINNRHYDCNKILKSLYNSYRKSRYFNEYYAEIDLVFQKNKDYLCSLNTNLIKTICNQIGIKTNFLSGADLISKNFNKIELLSQICELRKAKYYISTLGSKVYLGNLKNFPDNEIGIKYFDYNHEKYNQIGNNFISFLSIIDLLFNEGPNTIEILRKNFTIL
jgi:hypothetical protein